MAEKVVQNKEAKQLGARVQGLRGGTSALLFILGLMNFSAETGGGIEGILAPALLIAFIILGLAGIWVSREILILLSVGALLGMIFINPTPYAMLSSVEAPRWILDAVFIALFILYIELGDNVVRFARLRKLLARSAEEGGIGGIAPTKVLRKSVGFLPVLLIMTFGLALLIFNITSLLSPQLDAQFAESVEYNSVYGIVIFAAMFFGIVTIIRTLLLKEKYETVKTEEKEMTEEEAEAAALAE